MDIPDRITEPQYLAELILNVFSEHEIVFSKSVAAKLVGGVYRLEKLVRVGAIRMDKPAPKQNGKWFCNAADVIDHIKLS